MTNERIIEELVEAVEWLERFNPEGVTDSNTPDLLARARAAAHKPNKGCVRCDRWRANSIDTWAAMNAMRNDINEVIPMPSIEGDLLQGPENSVFCSVVAQRVVEAYNSAVSSAAHYPRRHPNE